jgi:hypothetical protein
MKKEPIFAKLPLRKRIENVISADIQQGRLGAVL